MSSTKQRKDIYERVAQRLQEIMQKPEEFRQPWLMLGADHAVPHNPMSGTTYSGINQLLLSFTLGEEGYKANRWLTLKQINKQGGKVQKGETATLVVYTKPLFYDKNNSRYNLPEVATMSKHRKQELEIRQRSFLRFYHVFNVAQTKDLPAHFYALPEVDNRPEPDKNATAEALINATGAHVKYQPQNSAYYNGKRDELVLPVRQQFHGSEEFYEVAFHELAHWTGHPDRLNREKGKFPSKAYALEELTAELTSAFVCARLGFTKPMSNNANYLHSWTKALREDNRLPFKAVTQAQRAADYIFLCKEVEERQMDQREGTAAVNLENIAA